ARLVLGGGRSGAQVGPAGPGEALRVRGDPRLLRLALAQHVALAGLVELPAVDQRAAPPGAGVRHGGHRGRGGQQEPFAVRGGGPTGAPGARGTRWRAGAGRPRSPAGGVVGTAEGRSRAAAAAAPASPSPSPVHPAVLRPFRARSRAIAAASRSRPACSTPDV